MTDKMQKIVPHLWFDKEAADAARFYTSLFDGSSLDSSHVIENTPSGDAESVYFTLAGIKFLAISAGPFFNFNPSVSLLVYCGTAGEVDTLWNAFMESGSALMELGEYPFSKRYGWVKDKYGLSWQLVLMEDAPQKITPNLLFSGGATGKAEEAILFYAGVFPDSAVGHIHHYAEGEAHSERARVNFANVKLRGFNFSAMDNAFDVDFGFNEAVSFIVECRDQDEIDYYWDKLSAVPEAEQCGWIKDKFGVSWQIVPENMESLLFGGTPEENRKVTEVMLKMKKLDIAALKNARA